ncbi:MAG: ExbD/TolR family protein [Phycisphaerae bacterium]
MRHRLPEPASDRVPNLAPMVDIIMVLLVFFMLGASLQLVREGLLQTELDPRSGPGAGVAIEINPVVKIGLQDADAGASCRIFVVDESIGSDFDALRALLDERRRAGADPANPVVIGAEASVKWRFVVAAMDAAVRAGFDNVQFAVALGRGSFSE